MNEDLARPARGFDTLGSDTLLREGRHTMTRRLSVALALAAALAAGMGIGCGSTASPASPSALGAQALQGAWSSTSTTTAQNTCTNFKWSVTSISGNTGSGTT